MRDKKMQWESYHIDDYKKDAIQKLKEELDPEEDEEEIEELNSAETIYSTPLGIFLKNDEMNPLRSIEHWLCRTNFDVNLQVASLINKIEGVETLTVVTRYQFIVGFGKLFNVKEVKKDIEKTITEMEDIPKPTLSRLCQKTLRETFLGATT